MLDEMKLGSELVHPLARFWYIHAHAHAHANVIEKKCDPILFVAMKNLLTQLEVMDKNL